jgi:6-phosphogluconate dehydrogenase
MKLGYIGLGKMGFNMVERMLQRGHGVIAFDSNEKAVKNAKAAGIITAQSIEKMVKDLDAPRAIWVMVPNKFVGDVISELKEHLAAGDTIIDGGNSLYKDSMIRAGDLRARGINFMDVGVSGGPGGAKSGACLMIGGEKSDYDRLHILFRDLAAPGGYGYMGKSGAGHFVKMVHNGIEYGMMQAIAEGFSILKKSEFALDLKNTAAVYSHASVIESRLIGWVKDAFEKYGENLGGISGTVGHTGEGAWTVEVARALGVSVPIIEGAMKFRIESEKNPNYTGKILSALRNQFGGHDVKKS